MNNAKGCVHEGVELLSGCCEVLPIADTNICTKCHDHTSFETARCLDCGEFVTVGYTTEF